MKNVTIKIILYEYDELEENAKEKAFNEHYYYLCSNPADYEYEEGNIKYMTEEEHTKEYVEDHIKMNEYLVFKNGKMAYTVKYCGEHEKAGITELKLYGVTYII